MSPYLGCHRNDSTPLFLAGGGGDHSNVGSTAAELASVDCSITCLTQDGDCLSVCHPGGGEGRRWPGGTKVHQNIVVGEEGSQNSHLNLLLHLKMYTDHLLCAQHSPGCSRCFFFVSLVNVLIKGLREMAIRDWGFYKREQERLNND